MSPSSISLPIVRMSTDTILVSSFWFLVISYLLLCNLRDLRNLWMSLRCHSRSTDYADYTEPRDNY
jgi:hypothetical protein